MHKYSLLHIEDNKADAVLLELHLKNSPFSQFDINWVKTLQEGLEAQTNSGGKRFDYTIYSRNKNWFSV